MKNQFVYFAFFSTILLLSSCVSSRKYNALEKSLMTAETNVLTTRQQIIDLGKDTARLGEEVRRLKRQVKQLEEYSTYTQSMLYKQMNEKTASLDETAQRLNDAESELKRTKATLEKVSASNDKNSKQLEKVEGFIKAQNKLITDLRKASSNVVIGFEGDKVEYVARDGKVRMIIPERVLFHSNSTSLTSGGEQSLLAIANVLAQNEDFILYIETHSDDNSSRNNWNFTSKRAINIAEFLIKGGVHPKQVAPAAKAEFAPVAMNDSAANKEKNRRVELVLSPNFQNMYDLLKMY